VHDPAPSTEYCPASHMMVVGLTLPPGHAYPALHGPVQSAVVSPPLDPYRPGLHTPLQPLDTSPDVAPYLPALQLLHDPAPVRLYVPEEHTDAVLDVDPAAHAYPALHSPEHAADVRPSDDPKVPAGHSVHTPAPDTLYRPATHWAAVALVDPAGHAYPAVHIPLQADEIRPDVAPNVPAGHRPEHAAVISPEALPYRPAPQAVHDAALPRLNVPGAHGTAVALVDPAGQAYPALQRPLHPAVARPGEEPYRPGPQGPVQLADDRPELAPYRPGIDQQGHAGWDVDS
jgi:hypothetical protein